MVDLEKGEVVTPKGEEEEEGEKDEKVVEEVKEDEEEVKEVKKDEEEVKGEVDGGGEARK